MWCSVRKNLQSCVLNSLDQITNPVLSCLGLGNKEKRKMFLRWRSRAGKQCLHTAPCILCLVPSCCPGGDQLGVHPQIKSQFLPLQTPSPLMSGCTGAWALMVAQAHRVQGWGCSERVPHALVGHIKHWKLLVPAEQRRLWHQRAPSKWEKKLTECLSWAISFATWHRAIGGITSWKHSGFF